MNYKQFIRPGNGASDITPLLNDPQAFENLILDLIKLFRNIPVDKIACIEGRGFLIGAPVALGLKTGLIPIRIKGKLKNEAYSETFIDYSRKEKTLEIHRDAVKPGEKVILIDDWVETGGSIKASIKLIEKCGGEITSIGAFMDDSSDDLKQELKKYNYQYLDKVAQHDKF